ncbi:MAG: hypothetical protein JWP92_2781 [Caulobacter sp.]|nr:hypothetical protein [Caulobacter sp.]
MGVRAFSKMGDIRGKSPADIKKKVGSPTSISERRDGRLYQWIKAGIFGGYHYAILFDKEERAVGFTHQHVSGWLHKMK